MVYPNKIAEWLDVTPSPCSNACDLQGVGRAANFRCGCIIRFLINTDIDGIIGIQHESNGCGYMKAAASVVERYLNGRSILELGGLAKLDLLDRAEKELGQFPEGRVSCLDAVINAVHDGFADHRRKRIEGAASEKALICTCFGISEERINEVIAANPWAKVDDVKGATNAGRGCGSCLMLIEEMLEQAKARELEF